MTYFPRLNQLYVLIDAKVGLREIDQMGIDFYEKYTIPYHVSWRNSFLVVRVMNLLYCSSY
jgi:GTP-binding protein EngB required for normal cell division